jgi:hypothetical protein
VTYRNIEIGSHRWLEFVKILIFIIVDIFKHTAKKIRILNEQIKFYLKCMVPQNSTINNYFTVCDKKTVYVHKISLDIHSLMIIPI